MRLEVVPPVLELDPWKDNLEVVGGPGMWAGARLESALPLATYCP